MNEIWRLLCRGGIGLEASITSKWRVADLRGAVLRVGPGRGAPPLFLSKSQAFSPRPAFRAWGHFAVGAAFCIKEASGTSLPLPT